MKATMRKFTYILFAIFILYTYSCTSDYESNNVVVTPHPLATEVGQTIFELGGNAFDVAVASGFALSVVEPSMSGIGGRMQAIYFTNDSLGGIDGTTQVPSTYVHDEYEDGYKFIGVPGVVHGLIKLHESRGNLTLQQLLKPSIELASNGFELTKGNIIRLNMAASHIRNNSKTDKYYLGEPLYQIGDTLIQKDLANVLIEISNNGIDGFYSGWVAEKIAKDIENYGGYVTLDDLRDYKSGNSVVVSGDLDNYSVHSLYLPSFGPIVIQLVQLLVSWPNSIETPEDYINMFYPISQYVYTNSRQQQFIPDSLNNIISFDYNRRLAKTINSVCCAKKSISNNIDSNTAHISVVDSHDNVVSLTQTVGPLMGSGVITDSLGFVYATTMGSYLGITEANQRAYSHISPTIILKNNSPVMVLGAAGGSRIPTSIAQVIYRHLYLDDDLYSSVTKFRVHPDAEEALIEYHNGVEFDFDPDSILFKYDLIDSPARFGRVQAISRVDELNKWIGVSDPDWEGTVFNSDFK
ncbi:MAG: hypothetical protein CNE38_02635 [Rhodothermaeota bacterium MED-G12]|nr:MAG: hypothetical protein CNE38_02635 [Rhodothermaeota bacterium MED-G12]